VLERLRLTYGDLRTLNEALIFAHATGYGDLGDESQKPGYDATAWWARSGLMDAIRSTGSEPALPMAGMGDHPSAMALLSAILMALYRRQRTGKGAKVTSSLLANGVWSNSVMVQAVLCGASRFDHLSRKRAPNALVNIYESADARWFFLLMIQEDKDWERFARCIGRPDLLADPRFADKAARRKNAFDLVGVLDEVFASRTYDQWREILDAASITFGPVTQLADLADDQQLHLNGVLRGIEESSTRTIDSPISIDGYRKVAPRPAPEIGEHSDAILASLGYDASAIEDLRANKVIA
jgi:crotonobetainyl-CoA:carnitine CoA-transferase CaiB-like acyl-CoA transferase